MSGYDDVVAEAGVYAAADSKLASGVNRAIESGAGNSVNG
jgi:hypothetical protein